MKPNWDLSSIFSPVDPAKFNSLLEGLEDSEREFVCQGFAQGFQLYFCHELRHPVEYPNMPSVEKHLDVVWNKIQTEVEAGRVAGPFEHPPFKIFFCSPLGLVPKAGQAGKFRLIFNLSAGDPSVNSATPQKF